jgi:hypothetical protein
MLTWRRYRLRNALLILILSALASTRLVGQWHIGLEVGAVRFWGGSRDDVDGSTSFLPYRPTTLGIGLERQSGRYAFGLQARYAEAGVALVGPEVTVASEGIFTIVGIWPELVARLATVGSNNQLRIHAGPIFEIWDLVDLDSRIRVGAQGSISLDVPLGRRFRGAVAAGGAVTSSPYEEGELDIGGGAPTYELQALWRRSFALSLHYVM